MHPPFDSLRHQSHKLAEVISHANLEERSAPPPPYSSTVQYPSSFEDTSSETDYLDDSHDDYEDLPREHSNLNVHIDASINITGTGNTIIISPTSVSADSNSHPPPSNRPTSPAIALRAIQKQRQTRVTDIATAIISALGQTSVLHPTGNQPLPSVEIKINTGIKMEGSKNVIYAGTSPRVISRGIPRPSIERDQQGGSRKRRAQSVCSVSPLHPLSFRTWIPAVSAKIWVNISSYRSPWSCILRRECARPDFWDRFPHMCVYTAQACTKKVRRQNHLLRLIVEHVETRVQ